MKLKAKIEITINVKENESPDQACERAVTKLVDLVDGWVAGEKVAPVHYEFTHGSEVVKMDNGKKLLN